MRKFIFTQILLIGFIGSAMANDSDKVSQRLHVDTIYAEKHITEDNKEGKEVVVITSKTKEAFTLSVGGIDIDIAGGSKHPKRKRAKLYIGNFRLGWNYLFGTDYSGYPSSEHGFLKTVSKSITVSFDALGVSFPLGKRGNWAVSTAVGFKWDNITFDNLTLEKGEDGKIHPIYLEGNYKKSKLTTSWLHVPLDFHYKYRGFRVTMGIYADFSIGSHIKYKRPKVKKKGDFAVNDVQFGIAAAMGYKGLGIQASYGFTNYFQTSKAPKAKIFNIGFAIGF